MLAVEVVPVENTTIIISDNGGHIKNLKGKKEDDEIPINACFYNSATRKFLLERRKEKAEDAYSRSRGDGTDKNALIEDVH